MTVCTCDIDLQSGPSQCPLHHAPAKAQATKSGDEMNHDHECCREHDPSIAPELCPCTECAEERSDDARDTRVSPLPYCTCTWSVSHEKYHPISPLSEEHPAKYTGHCVVYGKNSRELHECAMFGQHDVHVCGCGHVYHSKGNRSRYGFTATHLLREHDRLMLRRIEERKRNRPIAAARLVDDMNIPNPPCDDDRCQQIGYCAHVITPALAEVLADTEHFKQNNRKLRSAIFAALSVFILYDTPNEEMGAALLILREAVGA